MKDKKIEFTVIMPTYNQATYIRRAISSLLEQTYSKWELIIINDGCTDETEEYIKNFLIDARIHYTKNLDNQGLGYTLNQGLEMAQYEYIAYLPSDDYYYEDHLQTLKDIFEQHRNCILAYTRAGSYIADSALQLHNQANEGLFDKMGLQLVQTAHKKTFDRWVERNEWVSEDLFKMFWHKLTAQGDFLYVDKETCFWSIHYLQRHQNICEFYGGGLNFYRGYYRVKTPIKLKTPDAGMIDEEYMYKPFHKTCHVRKDALKILLVGELAYNPERIYALEEAGHLLYGLWISNPSASFLTVGPLPFGHVINLSQDRWEEEIERIKPDIIYALLNCQAIMLGYKVLRRFPNIPFVWHFKEGPFLAQNMGLWEKLIYLYHYADGRIYINSEMQEWYEQFVPSSGLSFIMDGDLPKSDYFSNEFSPRLSASDGEIHTVAPGRLVGVTFNDIEVLAANKVHIHLYNSSLKN